MNLTDGTILCGRKYYDGKSALILPSFRHESSSYVPESYNLPSFKSKISKLDRISLSP